MEVQSVISKLFQAVIGVVIGLAMLPVVIDTVDDLITDYTGTFGTGAEALVELIPLFYVIIIVVGAIAYVKFSK